MAIKSPIPKKPNNILRLSLFWVILVIGVLAAVAVTSPHDNLKSVPLSQVIQDANNGDIAKIQVQGDNLTVTPKGSDAPTQKSIKDSVGTLEQQGLQVG